MNELLREHAPISAEAWREIDAEATRTLKTLLAARRLVDFEGPLGWTAASHTDWPHARSCRRRCRKAPSPGCAVRSR